MQLCICCAKEKMADARTDICRISERDFCVKEFESEGKNKCMRAYVYLWLSAILGFVFLVFLLLLSHCICSFIERLQVLA